MIDACLRDCPELKPEHRNDPAAVLSYLVSLIDYQIESLDVDADTLEPTPNMPEEECNRVYHRNKSVARDLETVEDSIRGLLTTHFPEDKIYDFDFEPRRISAEDCINGILEAERRLGHSPGYDEYKEGDFFPSMKPILDTFGTWNKAKTAAGLDTTVGPRGFSKQKCLDSLLEAAEEIGHSPTMAEYNSVKSEPSGKTVGRMFGGWNSAKKAAGLEAYKEKK